MNWRKVMKWTGLAVAVMAVVGMIGVYRVFRHYYPPLEAILIVENMTEKPVDVVGLIYDGRPLLKSPRFLHLKVYPNLKPSQDLVDVALEIKRPGNPKSEMYTFIAKQGEYVERCAFQVRIEMTGARMSDCVSFR